MLRVHVAYPCPLHRHPPGGGELKQFLTDDLKTMRALQESIRTALGNNDAEAVSKLINEAMQDDDAVVPAFQKDITAAISYYNSQVKKTRKPQGST
eukprot:14676344-Alexandrium_andersonii.AAC.1